MPTTLIAASTTPGNYSQTGEALTWTAGDTVNNNHVAATADLVLLVWNTNAGAQTVTITSVADPTFGRTGDVSAQSIAAGEIRQFRLTNSGWANGSDEIVITPSHADLDFAVFTRNS